MCSTNKLNYKSKVLRLFLASCLLPSISASASDLPETGISSSTTSKDKGAMSAYSLERHQQFKDLELEEIDKRLSKVDGEKTYDQTVATSKANSIVALLNATDAISKKALVDAAKANSKADTAQTTANNINRSVSSNTSRTKDNKANIIWGYYNDLKRLGAISEISSANLNVLMQYGIVGRSNSNWNTGRIRHENFDGGSSGVWDGEDFMNWACSKSRQYSRSRISTSTTTKGYITQSDPYGSHRSHTAVCYARYFNPHITLASIRAKL